MPSSSTFRTDIQALRGIAVLLVVFYHARLLPVKSGFLGVDIFFVISGFLITSQIAKGIDRGGFSFASFYYRRAMRLLPAAYTVFLTCLLLSPWLLSSLELWDFAEQMLGALSFTSNMVLWQQTGYFESAAELKPLLHTWSLSIEEQYYLLLPLLLVALSRTHRTLALSGITIASLILLLITNPVFPGASFFLFPTRFWELGIGSILAVMSRHGSPVWQFSAALSPLAAICLLVIPILGLTSAYSSSLAIVAICVATAVLIDARANWFNNAQALRPLVYFGTISYSLYLVHWPIYSFLANANIGGAGLWWPLRLSAVVASILLAQLLYTGVEQRFRLSKQVQVSARAVRRLFGCTILLALGAGYVMWLSTQQAHHSHRTESNIGLSLDCSELNFASLASCRTSAQPSLMVWGDSYAMHWMSGLLTEDGIGVVQATRATCAPVLETALYAPPKYGRAWSERCIEFNNVVLSELGRIPSVNTVILGGLWNYMLNATVISRQGDAYLQQKLTTEELLPQLTFTIDAIRRMGKKVVVMAPPPATGFEIGRCIEKKRTGKVSFGAPVDCKISFPDYQSTARALHSFLQQLSEKADVEVFDLQGVLCDQQSCLTELDGVALYRDAGHLSVAGSILLAERLDLVEQLRFIAK